MEYPPNPPDEPVNVRPNVFTSILQLSPGATEHKGLQVEMHLRAAPDATHFTVLLNAMRLMCVFDWLLVSGFEKKCFPFLNFIIMFLPFFLFLRSKDFIWFG